MSRQDDNILKCARRMVKKYNEGTYSKIDGEYSKPVQVEIERMKKHCIPLTDKVNDMNKLAHKEG